MLHNRAPNTTSEILDRMPPQNSDAERNVIGSMLLLPRCIGEVADVVSADDFYGNANQRLFRHLVAMDATAAKIDATLLLERLHTSNEIEAVGGAAYIGECLLSAPHVAHVVYYAKIVRDRAILRRVIYAATETLQEAYYPTDDPQSVVARAEQRFQAVEQNRSTDLLTASDLAVQVGDFVDDVCERGSHLGLPTGLPEFDDRIGGLFPGELIVLAARPGVGKSALAGQIADYAASTGRLVYVASLEMTGRELAQRTICSIADIDGRTLRTGRVTPDDLRKLVEGMATFAQRKLILDGRPNLTVEALARVIRRLMRDGLELAVVDYLGLLTPSDSSIKRYEQVSHQTRALKLLARETGIRLLVLCQLNRAAAEDASPPQLHHLRESGSIEQDADMVLFIHRPDGGILIPDPGDKHKKTKADWPAELLVAKQRNGTTGRLKLDWSGRRVRFSCYGHQEDAFSEFQEFV